MRVGHAMSRVNAIHQKCGLLHDNILMILHETTTSDMKSLYPGDYSYFICISKENWNIMSEAH